MNKMIFGNTVLVTGAGGSIGSALTRRIAAYSPHLLVLLDHSEQNLYQIESDLTLDGVAVPLASALGDICNEALLSEIFERYRPNIVYHAAAFKHVPLMERNPIAAIQNNVLGTNVLARAARKHGVQMMTMVSTDKAVRPRSIMGASKRVAELALVRWASKENQMNSIRLGNVYGTEGSVVKLFAQQILTGGPVTVTHADATRYFLSLEEAVDLIMLSFRTAGCQDPDPGPGETGKNPQPRQQNDRRGWLCCRQRNSHYVHRLASRRQDD